MRITSATTRLGALVSALAMGAAVAPAAASTGAAWTSSTTVASSSGWAQFTAATSPDGATAIVWTEPGTASGSTIMASVRPAGSATWFSVPASVDNTDISGDLALAAGKNGRFWLTWVDEAASDGELTAHLARLNTTQHQWGTPTQLFGGYTVEADSAPVAVTGNGTIAVTTAGHLTTESTATLIATKPRGQSWSVDEISIEGETTTGGHSIAAGQGDEIVVAWVQSIDATQVGKIIAATRADASVEWTTANVSPLVSPTAPSTSVGADGTAAIVYRSWGDAYLCLATTPVGDTEAGWNDENVVAASPVPLGAPQVSVDAAGDTTFFWSKPQGSGTVVMAQARSGAVLGAAVEISLSAGDAIPVSAVTRTDGDVDVLLYESSADRSGLRILTMHDGVASGIANITDSSDGTVSTDDDLVAAVLGVDAAGRSTLVFGTADDPAEIVQVSQQLGKPTALTSAFSGELKTSARLAGTTRVGETVTCASGYWVGATDVQYRWLRNGLPLVTTATQHYDLTSKDKGHTIQCRAVATNDSTLTRVLSSTLRKVR
jgi:hypothetical protein